MPKVKKTLLLAVAASVLCGCMNQDVPERGSLQHFFNLGKSSRGFRSGTVTNIRHLALEELALSIGAQCGLQQRGRGINHMLKRHAKDLDQTFNFHAMLLKHNVLPPVLLDGHSTINIDKPNMIRLTDRTYTIHKQARFVSAPPNWRQYLIMEYRDPEQPHPSVLPQNRAERRVWQAAMRKGYEKGLKQADSIFRENLARLQQDFEGMINYRKLLAQGMVSAPYVAKLDLGITGNAERMDINDQVLHITAMPAMQINGSRWKAAVTPDKLRRDHGQVHANGKHGMQGKHVSANAPREKHLFKQRG